MSAVAVITRTKNRCLLLRRAIESVLAQSFSDWTHVIVNDGGAAEDVDALVSKYSDQYGGRLIVLHNQESLGMEAASNHGIRASRSKYVVIHDDDDSWGKEFLETCVGYLEHNTSPSVKGVVTHTRSIRERIVGDKVEFISSHSFDPWLSSVTLPAMSEVNKFMPISFLYERKVLDAIGFYDETLPVIGDWEFNLRFLMSFDIRVLREELANYHIRETASSENYNNTVTSGKDLHEFYRSLVINKYVRAGFGGGQTLALLMMSGDYSYRVGSGIWRLNTIIDSIKTNRLVSKFRRWFL